MERFYSILDWFWFWKWYWIPSLILSTLTFCLFWNLNDWPMQIAFTIYAAVFAFGITVGVAMALSPLFWWDDY